ncbi:TetR/AcrR family transcriptional regulator [Gluconacetobacter entanii]|uniref:TetR/AcrR family transcriptional regulator n=1 Tax=Gluconacetobacter entanii TaxID=108528 RepID=UPI001C935397|nr:TetR/AcrR family transcriptional regulator [Gluconacetobacter entanii]MBY4639939.1 TetR/AcrR family transcriptional regulator [Gluconacetobacter entanii]MCW4581620.1 TetR/AcrR family transcriptional regulator [Gluconacetobacter entanii]MCW4584959.1 TetR/AcrR family transcriptional regulator [Gluconacetobacter entanii]MCW4588373.1 TetR/AcrR family transcriptional regulator [Gluconacetobacter entanii]
MEHGTRRILMQRAEELIRTRGYAAFSFADLAQAAGIRKASVHHHFPTKEALGCAVIEDYLHRFTAELSAVRRTHPDAPARLRAFAGFFSDSAMAGMLPLCAALAAQRDSLPLSMRRHTAAFFRLHLDWLTAVMADGIAAGTLRGDLPASVLARRFVSLREGTSLLAWGLGDSVPDMACDDVLHDFLPDAMRAGPPDHHRKT